MSNFWQNNIREKNQSKGHRFTESPTSHQMLSLQVPAKGTFVQIIDIPVQGVSNCLRLLVEHGKGVSDLPKNFIPKVRSICHGKKLLCEQRDKTFEQETVELKEKKKSKDQKEYLIDLKRVQKNDSNVLIVWDIIEEIGKIIEDCD